MHRREERNEKRPPSGNKSSRRGRPGMAVVSITAFLMLVGFSEIFALNKLEESFRILTSPLGFSDAVTILKCNPSVAAATPKFINVVSTDTGKVGASLRDLVASPLMVQLGSDQLETVSFATTTSERPAWMDDPEWEGEQCVPLSKWQLPSYGHSSCNLLHEMDMTEFENGLEMINCGGSRCAFQISDGVGNKGVLKITK